MTGIVEAPARSALVLIVDDDEANRTLLVETVQILGRRSLGAANGRQGLELMRSEAPDLVLLDIEMPVMNGLEVLRLKRADELVRDIPVIVISGMSSINRAIQCIELGADDYLTKPFDAAMLRARMNSSLEKKSWRDQAELYRRMLEDQNTYLEQRIRTQVQLIQQQSRQLSSAQSETILALSKLAENRDSETGAHLERMRENCRVLSEVVVAIPKYRSTFGGDFLENIYSASPLHDIGKVGIPDAILQKPGRLTVEEFDVMKTHTTVGADTLRTVHQRHPGNAFVFMGIEIAACHHERWDGSGYPAGLAGDAIPLSARVVALADVYDALTSERCYKEAFPHEEARRMILEGRGSHFDPDVVDGFLKVEHEFVLSRRRFSD